MAKLNNMLCLDPASTHLAYTISEIQGDELYIKAIGMLWTKPKWHRGQRFLYMDRCLDALVEGIIPQNIIHSTTTEAYFVNFKQRSGVAVVPTINGFIEKTCAKYKIPYDEISSSVWRKELQIKPDKTVKTGKYKHPTKLKVEEYIGKVPTDIVSNITRKPRALPNDVTDVLAITIANAKRKGVTKVVIANAAYTPMTNIEKFYNIAKEI